MNSNAPHELTDMANVTITREEAEDDLLPDVCPITGEECVHRVQRSFGWSPGWVWFFVLCMPLVGFILWLCLRQRMTVRMAVVARARTHWTWRTALAVPCGVVGWLFAITALRALPFIGILGQMEWPHVVIAVGISFAVPLLCIAGLIPWFRSVRATAITPNRITLTNVHTAFTSALREGRAEREREEAEDEERRRSRRQSRPRVAYSVDTPLEDRHAPPPPPPPPPNDPQAPWW